ncbi:unnamed protein product [Effrenium voratum]|uniref:Uncharacterized protein n=1 Tax=Effrenium voratum TaxID=2562239 RepID=A0AA36IKM5_9DINO|nr:unnamed protein product [Effrenium voratum]
MGLFLRLDECPYTVGDLQNHFATDCTKPVLCFLHASHCSIVLALASIGVVCWHLTELTGSAGPVGMLVFVVAAPLQLILTQRIKRASKRTQECRDVRGRLCNEFLGAMRVVKCFTLEQVALGLLGVARDAELEAQWMKRKVFPISNCLGSTVSLFATIVSFLWLELVLDRPVDAAIAFTVLSWANLLKDNIMQLPNQVASILDAYVGITRVQQLLCCEASNGAWLQDSGYALDVVPTQDADFILQDCDLGWPVSEEEHGFRGARQISLKVQPGELLLVSGPIGAGKSALLEGLTGTKPVQGGSCWRRGRSTAYVAQRPWLLNGTLLENILFGQSFNQQKLTETLESCALAQDLNSLPSGLDTLVGEEGVQLSGGQKQRVSLARAVYSGAQVVLMDDVLSALDAHVGHHVFEEVICKALSGRTRILVTHQVQYWSHPAVSRVLRLDAFGRCEFLGAFDGQNAAAAKAAEEEAAVEAVVEEEEKAPESGDPSRPSAVSSRQAASVELRRAGRILREDLMAYAKACGGLAGVFSIASLMVVYYGSQLASSLQLAFWSNANVQAEDSGQPEARDVSRRYLVQYLLLCLLTGASCFSFFFGIQLVALRGSKRMHDSFMKGLIYTHLRFFDVTPTGRALNRCLKDMATVDDRMPAAFRELFQSFMNVVISMLILGLFAWQALVVVPPFSVLYWMILTVYRWPARDLRRLEGVSRSPGMSHFADSVKGARTIRAFGHEARFLERNLTLLGENQLTTYWFWVAQAWVSCFQEILGTLALAFVTGIVGYRAFEGILSPGLAGLALSYALQMPRDLMWLSRRLASMEVEFVAIERIMEYTRLPPEAPSEAPPGAAPETASAEIPPDVAIYADELYLRYDVDGPLVFNGLSLSIPKSTTSALVGRTGCGKSSFLSALVRLYPLSGGHLYVHGHDVQSLSLPFLRSVVRVLLQDPIFFSGTIRSNLLSQPPSGNTNGRSMEDEGLWRCLRQAGLEKRVAQLPNQLDARVEENGQNFSQGERQLLCLARVLVEPKLRESSGASPAGRELQPPGALPQLLLCDEPTAACDLETDKLIHETLLQGLNKDWTLVVVCHRLHYIREFDNIFVFEEGRVVERGNPEFLLRKANGQLAKMCQQQGVLHAERDSNGSR